MNRLNILYVSKLNGHKSFGPTYSVPAQIKAQMIYDNVFWLNLTDATLPEWNYEELVCHDITSIVKYCSSYGLSSLVAPSIKSSTSSLLYVSVLL